VSNLQPASSAAAAEEHEVWNGGFSSEMKERRTGTGRPMKQSRPVNPDPVSYRIRVQGSLDKRRSDSFEGMTIGLERASDDTLITTLTGAVPDQARLRGILSKLWDLNLTLISVTRIEPPKDESHWHQRGG
jgi:hypothetical protein